jgi:hypothetical protein
MINNYKIEIYVVYSDHDLFYLNPKGIEFIKRYRPNYSNPTIQEEHILYERYFLHNYRHDPILIILCELLGKQVIGEENQLYRNSNPMVPTIINHDFLNKADFSIQKLQLSPFETCMIKKSSYDYEKICQHKTDIDVIKIPSRPDNTWSSRSAYLRT